MVALVCAPANLPLWALWGTKGTLKRWPAGAHKFTEKAACTIGVPPFPLLEVAQALSRQQMTHPLPSEAAMAAAWQLAEHAAAAAETMPRMAGAERLRAREGVLAMALALAGHAVAQLQALR